MGIDICEFGRWESWKCPRVWNMFFGRPGGGWRVSSSGKRSDRGAGKGTGGGTEVVPVICRDDSTVDRNNQ